MKQARKLICENGREFVGTGFGSGRDAVCELVFNTSMVGYQEILSDLSYAGQAVCMTYPLIGNYGLADEDYETKSPQVGALIVREHNDAPSNYRYTKTLAEEMEEYGIPGLAGIDTRALTRMLRDAGPMRGLLCDATVTAEEGVRRIAETPVPHDLVARVSCKKPWYSRTANYRFTVAALDCGIRRSTIEALHTLGCNLVVLPHNASCDAVRAVRPDGLLVAGGPGDPNDAQSVCGTLAALAGELPLLGVGLGCALAAMALGAQSERLPHPHHGANHTVKSADGVTLITVQSHSYGLTLDSLRARGLAVTHTHSLDGTAEGFACAEKCVRGVLYHPSADDAVFTRFLEDMEAVACKGGVKHA